MEGLFEDIIDNELIHLVELPRLQTEIEVKNEINPKANRAMRVYQQIAGRDSAGQQTALD